MYEIYNEAKLIKIDVALYLLCLMQPMIVKKAELLVSARHYIKLAINSQEVNAAPHIVVKCMYAVGGYRILNAANWIVSHMKHSELYRIQGVHAFSQLLRGKIQAEDLTQAFMESLTTAVDMIDPTSPLFETLFLNNYNELLSHWTNLHHACVRKVVQYMVAAASAHDQPNTKAQMDIAIFNMFEGILEKEIDMMRLL